MRKLCATLLLLMLLSGCAVPKDSPQASAQPVTPQPSSAQDQATPQPQEKELSPETVTKEELLTYMQDDPAPDFTLPLLTGEEVSLSDYRGKIVILNFWQSWCGPCKVEMPEFEKLMAEQEDVVVLAVNTLAGERESSLAGAETVVRDFIDENGFTFPVLIDSVTKPEDALFANELFASPYIPANYMIDREGIVRMSIQGAFDEQMLATAVAYMRVLDGE